MKKRQVSLMIAALVSICAVISVVSAIIGHCKRPEGRGGVSHGNAADGSGDGVLRRYDLAERPGRGKISEHLNRAAEENLTRLYFFFISGGFLLQF